MMISLPSASLLGVDAYRVDVEVDVAGGLPEYRLVGLAAAAIKEGASRVRSALQNCGQTMPPGKITVNLAPAERRKDSACFDLPIAVGIAAATGLFDASGLDGFLLMGELGLDGLVRPVRGVLAAAALAKAQGLRGVIVPSTCAAEACVVTDIDVIGIDHLSHVLGMMDGSREFSFAMGNAGTPPRKKSSVDFSDVRGQGLARRAMEIAMAGGHNILLYGPPGIGKTMIARRVPTILPRMTREEAIEVTKVYSAAGQLRGEGLMTERPFRAPHHSISAPALVGGGSVPKPGEISLAHRGVLFLDELPEFGRGTLEVLRQPLEEREIRIGRVAATVRLPAAFHLIAAANPCPCGFNGSTRRACTCAPGNLERYRTRLSGPLLDRIDIQVRIGTVSLDEMRGAGAGEPSAPIRERVEAARRIQGERLAPFGVLQNGEMTSRAQRASCRLSSEAERVLGKLYEKRNGMSARGLDRMVRVARTICDLDGEGDVIGPGPILEAAMYRVFDAEPTVDPRQYLPGRLRPIKPKKKGKESCRKKKKNEKQLLLP